MSHDINSLKNQYEDVRSRAEELLERFEAKNHAYIEKHEEVNDQVLAEQPFTEETERLVRELDYAENILQSEKQDKIKDAIENIESLIKELDD